MIALYYSYFPFFKPIFVLLVAGLISGALLEYYDLAQHKGLHPQRILGVSCAAAYMMALYVSLSSLHWQELPLFTLFIFSILFFLAYCRAPTNSLVNLAITVFGIAYLVIPLGCILKINYFFGNDMQQDGRLWLLYGLAVTKTTDIGAYFVGKSLGKKKLAATISPKKTIEGAIGGTCLAVFVSTLFYFFSPSPLFSIISPLKITFWQSIVMGVLISVLGQFGDLVESLLKRDAGVKDSSRFIPGLGGVLDSMDSLVFTLPFLYFVLKIKFPH